MATNQISAGDVVRLKSGGPRMTVEEVVTGLDAEFARCIWIDDKKKPYRENYPFVVLVPAGNDAFVI